LKRYETCKTPQHTFIKTFILILLRVQDYVVGLPYPLAARVVPTLQDSGFTKGGWGTPYHNYWEEEITIQREINSSFSALVSYQLNFYWGRSSSRAPHLITPEDFRGIIYEKRLGAILENILGAILPSAAGTELCWSYMGSSTEM